MKDWRSQIWLVCRIVLIVVTAFAIASYPRNRSNVDWIACLIISVLTSVGLFLWLTVIRSRPNVDWSEPHSWKRPFFPMNLYPVRFWFLGSISFIVGGGIAIAMDLIAHNGHEAFGGTFLFLGLGTLLALELWIKRFRT
jgi:hypothetical protein